MEPRDSAVRAGRPREAGALIDAPRSQGDGVRLQILGPLRLWRHGVELEPGSRQQASLLALLLARVGRPTSKGELIDLIWGDDVPESARNVIHKYVGALRRLLEPALPTRAAGSYLVPRGDGYVCAAGAGTLDLVAFRELVRAAEVARSEQHHEAGLDRYVQALQLWSGPAGDGLDHEPAAAGVFTRLNGEFFDACTAAGELAVSVGRPGRVVAPLQLAATMDPWHEPVHASLISTLRAAGREAEARSLYQALRARLADDLGIEPGPAVEAAHGALRGTARAPREIATLRADSLVGRADELAKLRRAVEPAFNGGTGLAVLVGEPGAGKTRLLEEIIAESTRRDALTAWGQCLDGDGAPSMWPWVQVVGTLLDRLPTNEREEWLAGELGRLMGPSDDALTGLAVPEGTAQFHLFERVVALAGRVAANRPLVLVLDDLQWADDASLRLFGHLAARRPGGTAIVGALRDRAPAPGSDLSRVLAGASRMPGHLRVQLGPLDAVATADLVQCVTGQPPGTGTADGIHARTGGNPFFIRELSRLLADRGDLTQHAVTHTEVPATVRDVVRDRMAGLDDGARELLEIAALVGGDVDLVLLARVADQDVPTCLGRLEPLDALGLLGPSPGDPFSFRFAHDLVRESVSEGTPLRRATALHLRVADALEVTGPDDESVLERVAHHLWAAGPLAAPDRTAAALLRAGRRAAAMCAFEAADRRLRTAAEVARTAGLAELELSALSQLTAIFAMRSGWMGADVDILERAEHLARSLGREREATGFLVSLWVAHAQDVEVESGGRLARGLLELGEASSDPIVHAHGLHAWGMHQWSLGNIGEAFRSFSRSYRIMLTEDPPREEDWLQHDQQVRSPVMLAEVTAVHGDVETARTLLDTVETAAGDDAYAITVWATFAARIAAVAGDPAWALRAAERGYAVDRDFSFAYLGIHQRVARCWALAVTGRDPVAAAAEGQELIAAHLLDPPRAVVTTAFGLLAEMHLAAGSLDEAAAALERADYFLETYGRRYSEGLLLLLRARLLEATGEPAPVVRAAAERAGALSTAREAHLFAQRAQQFLDGLDG